MTQPSGEKFKNIIFNSIEIIWGYKHIKVSLISFKNHFTISLPNIIRNDKVE